MQGDVPLLLSKRVLSGLGMLYDVELGSATFKHLGINDHQLAATESGHPAIIVRPKGLAGFEFPTPEEWAGEELRILPPSGNQYMVHMTCASEAVINADHALPHRGLRTPPHLSKVTRSLPRRLRPKSSTPRRSTPSSRTSSARIL